MPTGYRKFGQNIEGYLEFRLVSVDPEIGPARSTIDTMTAKGNISGDVPAGLL